MPSHYWYHCTSCDWEGVRYRNVKRCPACRSDVVREPPVDNRSACWVCGTMNRLEMFAYRKDKGAIVGWLFLCGKHAHQVADRDIVIEMVPEEVT